MDWKFPQTERREKRGSSAASILWEQSGPETWLVSVWACFADGGAVLLGRIQTIPGAIGNNSVALAFVSAPGSTGLAVEAETIPAGQNATASASVNFEPREGWGGGPNGLWCPLYGFVVP